MQIELERGDVLQLIDTGEIIKGDVTIRLRDSRKEAMAALLPPSDRVEIPVRPRVRNWSLAREVQFHKRDLLKD